jgi:hypothetical protein
MMLWEGKRLSIGRIFGRGTSPLAAEAAFWAIPYVRAEARTLQSSPYPSAIALTHSLKLIGQNTFR